MPVWAWFAFGFAIGGVIIGGWVAYAFLRVMLLLEANRSSERTEQRTMDEKVAVERAAREKHVASATRVVAGRLAEHDRAIADICKAPAIAAHLPILPDATVTKILARMRMAEKASLN